MSVTDNQEAAIAAVRSRVRQNKRVPHLINLEDGRLVPHTEGTAKLPTYRPYHGPLDTTAEDRLAVLATDSGKRARVVVSEPKAFDVGAASKDDLIAFAMDEYGVLMDDKKPAAALRKEVIALAESYKALA